MADRRTSILGRTSFDERCGLSDVGTRATARKIMLAHERDDSGSNLCATSDRRLNGVGVIRIVIADEAQVEKWDACREGHPNDRIVEDRQGGDGALLPSGIREAWIVNRAQGSRELPLEHLLHHRV